MIRFIYSSEKTNSYRPAPWHWSTEPFAAYRGEGQRHSAFQAVAKTYVPSFDGKPPSKEGYTGGYGKSMYLDKSPSKLIKTQKGTLLLIRCSESEDEQIMLITLRGGFRGGYSRVETKQAEILSCKVSSLHCVEVQHIVARLTNPAGYIFAETGRRSSRGLVEVFSWDDYRELPTEQFEAWRELQEERA